MKLFLVRSSFFILGLLILLVPIFFVVRYDNLDKSDSENHNIISLQTKSSYDSLDMLFVGNSYCYSSINTEILDSLDISSFNLGIATAGVQFYQLIINDYYENINVPPKIVFLLVTPMTFSSKSDNFSAYPIHRYLEEEKSNLEIIVKFSRYGDIISIFRNSLEKVLNHILFRRGTNQSEIRSNHKGYFPSDEIYNKAANEEDRGLYGNLKKETFEKSKLETLINLANQIDSTGSEVLFFELPTNEIKNYFNQKYLNDYLESIEMIDKEFGLIKVEQSQFKNENFRNIDHMNSSGAQIATREILRKLTNREIFKALDIGYK